MDFGDRACLGGVEDEGSVGALVAIDVGEGQTVPVALFGQVAEGALDVGDGVADVQVLRRLDAVSDGRGRMLLLLSRATSRCHFNG